MGQDPVVPKSRVELREVEEGDLPVFLEHQLDEEASRMAVFTPRDPEAFAKHWAKVLPDDSIYKRTVLLDGQVAGNMISFVRDDRREVGYWIGREHWGKGVATAALQAFVREIKERPLYANVAKHNVASMRVLEKCGFETIGENLDFRSMSGATGETYVLRLDE